MNGIVATFRAPVASSSTVAKNASRKVYWPLVVVLVMAAAVYVGTSAWPVILDETDGQYAGAAREMLERGDWLVPTNNGVPRLQKPPLVYWLTRLSLQTFGVKDGVKEFAARLPNALATVAWIFATYLIGERIGGRKRGLLAATIFGSMLGLFLFSHRIMPEPFLATFVSLAVWCFLSGLRNASPAPLAPAAPSSCFTHHVSPITNNAGDSESPPTPNGRNSAAHWFFWAWVFMGFAVMSKGLHGALYPLAVAGVTALILPWARPVLGGLASWRGIVAFLIICVPWYAVMAARFPGFLGYHFFSEQAGHAFNTSSPRDCAPVSFGVFWAEHIFFLFPWILFLPAAIYAWRTQKSRSGRGNGVLTPSSQANLEPILWIWILITALSISFSVRQDHYFMPAWGAIAVCLALPWAGQWRLSRKWLIFPCIVVALIGAGIAAYATFFHHSIGPTAAQVKPEAARADIQSAMRGLSVAVWQRCTPIAIIAGLAWLAGGSLAAALAWRGRATRAAFLLAGTMAVVFPMVMRGYTQLQDYFSLADAARVINRAAEPNALIACEGEAHLSASLFFYLNRQVSWAGTQTGSVLSAESHRIAVGPFVSDAELARDWHSNRQVFFIVEQSNVSEWERKLRISDKEVRLVARDGTRLVLVNQPATVLAGR